MSGQRIKESGQVLLETTLVFISLAAIAVGSMTIFAKLNSTATQRIDKYRNDRLNAVNAQPILPKDFLYKWPDKLGSTNAVTVDGGSNGILSVVFTEDPRIAQARICLKEQENIINLILPYKINQASVLAPISEDDLFWTEKCRLVKELCRQMIASAQLAKNDYAKTINLYQAALDSPLVDGPFDPEVADASRKTQNENNRRELQGLINQLKAAQPGLEIMLDQEIISRLRFAQQYIGTYSEIGSFHNQALVQLRQLVGYFGGSIPVAVLGDNLVQQIDSLYGTLEGGFDAEKLSSAQAISSGLSLDSQVMAEARLKDRVTQLSGDLGYVASYADSQSAAEESGQNNLEYYWQLSTIGAEALNEITYVNKAMAEWPSEQEKLKQNQGIGG